MHYYTNAYSNRSGLANHAKNKFAGRNSRDMRRRHAKSPEFSGHDQDLGVSSIDRHDSACNVILSVVMRNVIQGAGLPGRTLDFRGLAVAIGEHPVAGKHLYTRGALCRVRGSRSTIHAHARIRTDTSPIVSLQA